MQIVESACARRAARGTRASLVAGVLAALSQASSSTVASQTWDLHSELGTGSPLSRHDSRGECERAAEKRSIGSSSCKLRQEVTVTRNQTPGTPIPLTVQPAVATAAAWDAKLGAGLPDLDGSTSTFAWHGHHWLRAYASMAATYGDTKYIDKAVTTIDHMLKTAGAAGWPTPQGPAQQFLETAMISTGVMHVVHLVWKDPRFAAYRPKADGYMARIEQMLAAWDWTWVDKPMPGSTGSYIYTTPDGKGTHRSTALLMYNQSATMVTAQLLIDLTYRLKGQTPPPQYRARAAAVAAMFKSFATLSNGAYTWRYGGTRNDTDFARPIEDVGHATIDLTLLVWAHKAGIGGIDDAVMRGLAGTLRKVLLANGGVALNVDGTGQATSNWDRGHILHDWIDVVPFDPSPSSLLDKIVAVANGMARDKWSRLLLGWAEIQRKARGVEL